MHEYSEAALVERHAIALFAQLGWETVECFHERLGADGTLGRETTGEVVLRPRLRAALERLNPSLPPTGVAQAIEELTRDRSTLSPAQANRELYRLLKLGVRVRVPSPDGDGQTTEVARVVDWETPANNDFLLASQLWITGELHRRRPDLVGFVNGLPLLLVELKATHARVRDAYDHNLADYKDTIPHLFPYNALILLSNGSRSRVGSMTAAWEHFAEWTKIDSEDEEGRVSLETAIRGTCDPARLLDLVEHFTLYSEARGGLVKIVAKNHQYLGVNNAVEALGRRAENAGRLGVFWHTQGSGKSLSMVFFSQKVLRTLPGDYTFLVVTDRRELDDQIYKTYSAVGAVAEAQVQATSGEQLRRLLREDHRAIFTLIQKFHTGRGERYPELSGRSDIIVMTDEAHRSQYDVFALNMRAALPNAAFIGFTGTPLISGEERTREVFGPYVSVYNFRQSIDDGATVPLYYENRIPELQLTNEDLDADLEELIERAELDEEQERKLEREFGRQYHLITRDERLEKIAEDIVAHHTGREQPGKAMVVSIDKLTTMRMYDKVRRHWDAQLKRLRSELHSPGTTARRAETVRAQIQYMEDTDMAVVVSDSQGEVAAFEAKGLEIAPHRARMQREDLETRFKDPDDPFRIVFVCAMWMTGFDVPSLSTLYLDKPMRNHTLMQAIARANRVWRDKPNGLIVDYVGIFRDLQRALAIYGADRDGGAGDGELPVRPKEELLDALHRAVREAEEYCGARGIGIWAIWEARGLERVGLLDDAVEAILESEEGKNRFLALAAHVAKLFQAALPDPAADEYRASTALFAVLVLKIRALSPTADIRGIMAEVERLLDESVATEGYVIREPTGQYDADEPMDLSRIGFEALRDRFERGRRRTEAEKLKALVTLRAEQLVRRNRTRSEYLDRLRRLIEEYNAAPRTWRSSSRR